jgi:aldehyde:ferredoxin oxidoreductase
MAELKGVTGKIARVDLSSGTVSVIEPPEEVYKKYLGGWALGVYYLFKEGIVEPDVDPLGPDNMFQIMVGPVTGAGPNARSVIVTKSPYNFLCVSTCGGRAAVELKYAGWDGIQVVGKADHPVYLAIVDDTVEIRDASEVWGMGTEEAEMELRKRVMAPLEQRESILIARDLTPEWAELRPPKREGIGAKRLAAAWVIGPGGENQVWFSTVQTEGARAHGRYGSGAVAGSKNLKGIVVRGTKGQSLADKARFLELQNQIHDSETTNYFWRSYGTAGIGASEANVVGGFPIRNWQWESWADPRAVTGLTGPFMDMASFVRKQACPGCGLHCLYPVEVTSEDGMMDRVLSDMPDWEAMGMVGGNLGYMEVDGATPGDPYTGDHFDMAEGLAKTQYTTTLHDNNGLCFIEGGALLAMLMELRQRDLISPADLDGIDMQWGDVHAVDEVVKKIIAREGVGDVLANGVWETAKYLSEKKGNPEIMNYAITGHRYAQPAHGTRSNKDRNALEYVTVERPCEHTGGGSSGFMADPQDLDMGITGQNEEATVKSMVYCMFAKGNWGMEGQVEMLKAATGWTDFDAEEFLKVGARAFALSRIFSLYTQDITDPKMEWDCIEMFPNRWFDDPLPTGPFKGQAAFGGDATNLFDEALPEYWRKRGWTEDKGIPTAETLKELGIDDIAEAIAAKLR